MLSLVSNAGGDIAELMLDFIEWLTRQDFGRRCILSVRDILSWVNFLNAVCERDEDGFMTMGALDDEEEAEWDLRLDTVTAFIHAACLVYIDGIGSGEMMTYLRICPSGEVFQMCSESPFSCRNHSVLCRQCPPGSQAVPEIPATAAEQDVQTGSGHAGRPESLRQQLAT